MIKILKFLTILIVTSCATKTQISEIPSWYISPQQNDYSNLYGVSQGHTLEEATGYALADAASRLMVSISSTSNLIREENQHSVNEEMRQNIRQNIEKIDFNNFQVSKSEKIKEAFYVEVTIPRASFLHQQKEKLHLIETKLNNLDRNSANKNPIQKRNDLVKSQALAKDLELRARILSGAGANINLREKLNRVAKIENEMNQNLDNIEFFFEISSPRAISNIIKNSLNYEKIAVANNKNSANKNQILIKISSKKTGLSIYGSFITKLTINFNNSLEGRSLASSSIEVSGSSVIGKKESYAAALKSLERKIAKDGILKIIGILN